jgi:hypothetical protein
LPKFFTSMTSFSSGPTAEVPLHNVGTGHGPQGDETLIDPPPIFRTTFSYRLASLRGLVHQGKFAAC